MRPPRNRRQEQGLKRKLLAHQTGCWLCQDAVSPLTLHHRDGDRVNNTLENCILLCERCHVEAHRVALNPRHDKARRRFDFLRHALKCSREELRTLAASDNAGCYRIPPPRGDSN